MILFSFSELRWRQLHCRSQTFGGVGQVSVERPGRAEIGGNAKMLGMLPLSRPQPLNRFSRLAQANVKRSQVGYFVGREVFFLFQARERLLVFLLKRARWQ